VAIETKKTEETYVRIRPNSVTSPAAEFNGQVGKVISEGALEEGKTICFVKVVNESDIKVFNGSELERITRKEYFEGMLRG